MQRVYTFIYLVKALYITSLVLWSFILAVRGMNRDPSKDKLAIERDRRLCIVLFVLYLLGSYVFWALRV